MSYVRYKSLHPIPQLIGVRASPGLIGIMRIMDTQRVDWVGIGDSNQLIGAVGWDEGFPYALARRYPMYATGLVSAHEGGTVATAGAGSGTGYKYVRSNPGATFGVATGIAALDQFFEEKGTEDWGPIQPLAVADGVSYGSANNNGIVMDLDCPLDVTANLRFEVNYGLFLAGDSADSVNNGKMRPQIRYAESPFTSLVTSTEFQVFDAARAMAVHNLDLAAGARTFKLGFRNQRAGTAGVGPLLLTYLRVINQDRDAGFAYGTMYGKGSMSLKDMALAMQQWHDDAIDHYFARLVAHQTAGQERAVVVINSGLNDRIESDTSVGTGAVTDGNSPEAFYDNAQALVDRLRARWATAYEQAGLEFIFMVSQPQPDSGDYKLGGYRSAANQLCADNYNVSCVDLGQLVSYADILANDWHVSGDTSHLTQGGAYELASRVIDALRFNALSG